MAGNLIRAAPRAVITLWQIMQIDSGLWLGASALGVHHLALSLAAPQTRRLDAAMLRKCANPACTVPFRSLREGKLFLAETYPPSYETAANGNRRKLPRREHFWLCQACSSQFTLRFDTEQGMMTVPLSQGSASRVGTRVA